MKYFLFGKEVSPLEIYDEGMICVNCDSTERVRYRGIHETEYGETICDACAGITDEDIKKDRKYRGNVRGRYEI